MLNMDQNQSLKSQQAIEQLNNDNCLGDVGQNTQNSDRASPPFDVKLPEGELSNLIRTADAASDVKSE